MQADGMAALCRAAAPSLSAALSAALAASKALAGSPAWLLPSASCTPAHTPHPGVPRQRHEQHACTSTQCTVAPAGCVLRRLAGQAVTGHASPARPSLATLPPFPRPHVAGPPLHRSFSAVPNALSKEAKIMLASDVMNQVTVKRLRHELDVLAESRLYIPYSQFVEVAKSVGAVDDAAAAEYCAVLHKAGLVLRQNGTVYLRADEIAEMVMQLLPGGRDDTRAKLTAIEAELAAMDNVNMEIEKRSHRMANAILVGGLVILTTQFVAFIYLTWWELSWDVMEPIAYIIQLFYSLVAYIYFLTTRHSFDLAPVREFWATWFRSKQRSKVAFDADRYDFLRELQERYRRHLAHSRIKP